MKHIDKIRDFIKKHEDEQKKIAQFHSDIERAILSRRFKINKEPIYIKSEFGVGAQTFLMDFLSQRDENFTICSFIDSYITNCHEDEIIVCTDCNYMTDIQLQKVLQVIVNKKIDGSDFLGRIIIYADDPAIEKYCRTVIKKPE